MAWEHVKFVERPDLLLELVKEKLENPYSMEYKLWSFNEKANMSRVERFFNR